MVHMPNNQPHQKQNRHNSQFGGNNQDFDRTLMDCNPANIYLFHQIKMGRNEIHQICVILYKPLNVEPYNCTITTFIAVMVFLYI